MSSPAAPTARSWYALRNQTADAADLEIYDEIGGWGVTAKEFIGSLKALAGKHLNLRINSPGGSITDGQAIIAALKRHEGGFTAHIDGLAASMASVIACAAPVTKMAKGAMMFIHRAQIFSAGDAAELRKDADMLEKFEKGLIGIYQEKTGLPEDQIRDMMAEETWLDADEADEMGFVDCVVEGCAATAQMTPEAYKARFDTLRSRMNAQLPAPDPAPAAPAPAAAAPAAPAPSPAPAAPGDQPAERLGISEATARIEAMTADLASARADVVRLQSDLQARDTELTSLRALHEACKKSLGLAPADQLPPIQPAPADGPKSLLEEYEAMPKGPERLKFFQRHETELARAQKTASRK